MEGASYPGEQPELLADELQMLTRRLPIWLHWAVRVDDASVASPFHFLPISLQSSTIPAKESCPLRRAFLPLVK